MPGRRGASTVRIIGGVWRSRLIRFPGGPELRPTPDRVRETLFNWLGQDLTGLACLDLYAGSGALGFEAASRGAARVVLVEWNRLAVAAIRENVLRLGADNMQVETCNALEFLGLARVAKFDVIFLDPPFREGLPPDLLGRVAEHLADRGSVYLESDRAFAGAPGWRVFRHGRAGQVHFHLLERGGPD